ncbi:hypothetical protein BJV77DRAFT_112501 [Russula vinacea]|nr:hypothetical protein BJV77DRAFT_112501 [Russula vinacea]
MVGSTLPRSVSHSVADTAGVASGAGNLKAAIAMRVAGALAPNNPPRGRIGWTSRALAVRVHRSGLMAAHSVPAGDNNNSTDSLSGPPAPVSTSSPSPSPTTAATRAPAPVPVLAITCGAVGGVVALAVILALVYVRRVRRRVKSMKRLTNVLGPELAPMSPSQLLSPLTIDSPRVKFDGMHVVVPPRMASDLTNRLPPLSASLVSSSPTSTGHPSIPLSPVHRPTVILSLPPAARRSTIQSSDPRSPIRSSHAAVPWPLLTSRSQSDPQHYHNERSTSSNISESHTHT